MPDVFLENEAAQLALAGRLAKCTEKCSAEPGFAGLVIYLQGDLGAGKTTLVRGFLQGLGFQGHVKSPTYTLVEPYQIGSFTIHHFDLYRLGEPDELEYAGGRDYFDGQSINLIEWPEKATGYLPVADIECFLSYRTEAGIQGRYCELKAHSSNGRQMLNLLFSSLSN